LVLDPRDREEAATGETLSPYLKRIRREDLKTAAETPEDRLLLDDDLSGSGPSDGTISEEPLVVIDWDDDDGYGDIYIEEDSEEPAVAVGAPEEETPLAPAFPPELAERIRRRAWVEYARSLSANGRWGGPRSGRRGAARGGRVRAWIEMLVCVAIPAVVNAWLFPHDPGFRRLEFNPYLVPVVLLAVRYGTSFGLTAGLLSAAWILALGRRFSLEDGSLMLPGLLIVLGTLTGALSRGQGSRLIYFRNLVRKFKRERERVHRALAAKEAVIRDLQSRIETESVSASVLYQMSRGMGSENPREMYESLLRILSGDLNVTRAAVYERQGNEFVLASSMDRRVIPSPFAPALKEEGLAGLSLRLGRSVSIFDAEAEELGRGNPQAGVLCGPIRQAGAVRALVIAYDMELLDFGPATASRFSGLLEWARETLVRAARARGPRGEASPYDPVTGAHRLSHLEDILKRELARSRRTGSAPRVVEVRIDSYDEIAPERRRPVREWISRALFAQTREFDTIAVTDRGDAFVVLMPMCETRDPRMLEDRITEVIRRVGPADPIRLSFRFVDPEVLCPPPESLFLGEEAEPA
jgi:hypothetical protein